ncbi:hypothetical protein RUM44_003479 [Polyplax serrata]|uniref:Histone deacetylase complex subunit SAP130 C-terminal domain-containing protein n=1 Tax=Polyplax serrata TaxID=468196 RepID=A0ABR1AGK4_POLSC
MPGTEVSDKTSVDFGAKAVFLKSQSDSTRLLQGTGQIRSVPSQGTTRSFLGGVNTTHTPTPVLSNISSQKAVVTRVATTTIQTSVSTMGSLTRPPITAVSSVSHVTTSYHVPRVPAQVSNISARPNQGRFVTLQPVGISSTPTTASKPTAQQQIYRSSDAPRPLLLHTAPQKPVTLTQATQLHISTDKSLKAPSVTQVLPVRLPLSTSSGLIGPTQGSTIVQSAVCSSTVLTTPVRLNVSTSQPPLISTQRVSMTATPGTVLASRITVPAATTGTAVTVSGQPRIPSAIGQGTVIAASNRVSGTAAVTQTTTVIPAQTRLVAGQNTILATPARIGTQIVSGQPAVLTATARIASAGTTVLSTSKPTMTGSQTTVMTTATRMPATGVSNHQPTPTRVVTSTTTSNVTRFTVSAPVPSTRSTTSITSQITTPTMTPRLTSTPSQSTGIVVHPQLVVNATKSTHGPNHMSNARPVQIHGTGMGQKVITQALHGPIQITQSPVNITTTKVITQPSLNTVQTTITTTLASKPMCYTPSTSVTTRPVAVVASQSIPIAKIFPQNSGNTTNVADNEVTASQTVQPPSSSVYIHRTLPSPGLVCTSSSLATTNAPTLSTYTLPGGASYFYEAPSGYQLATDAPLVARPLSPDTPLVSRQLSSEGPLIARPFTPSNNTFVSQTSNNTGGLIAASQHMRFNSVMIVDQAAVPLQPNFSSENSTLMISESPLTSVTKLNSSPRPSILRKRDNEASPAKATKNLTPILSSASVSRSASPSPPSLHVDTNQQSNDHGPSSNGSTTISATSSPGPDDPGENIMPVIKTEFSEDVDRPPVEMSPRKKPRKQLLNDANDAIEMEFISDDRIKKEREEEEDLPSDKVYVVKRPNVSLLHSYKHNWKSRHNHFLRYSDVKPKDERRQTVTDLANQKQVVQKVNGWKVYHLSTQMEDLTEMESHVLDRLSSMLQTMDRTSCKDIEKDVNRVNDLIMGNIQRSKVIKDQMHEAKTQMMKVFDHKVHVSEIISRCASKRNFKKRDKY